MTRNPKPPTARLNATLYAMALEELSAGPTTSRELMEHTGLSRETIMAFVSALHKRRLIHVAAWERDGMGRLTIQAFQLGRKADLAKPPRRTWAELKRASRERRAMASPFSGALAANDSKRRAA